MTDSNSVQSGLATLGGSGWAINPAWPRSGPAYTSYDSSGNVNGLIAPSGQVIRLSLPLAPGAAAAALATNLSVLATALIGAGEITVNPPPGSYGLGDTLMVNSNTELHLGAGVVITSTGATRFCMLTTMNAVYSGAGFAGVMIGCASDGTTPGVGTLRQAITPAKLFYTAPGDTEGAGVDVSGATSGAARFELASANGKKLYVAAVPASMLGVGTASVRIGSNQGAVPVAWARTSNITTVTETGHTRRPGEALIAFGTGFAANVFIETVVAGTSWTFTDSRGDSSGSGEVLGKRNIRNTGGGEWNYGMANGTSARSALDKNTINIFGCTNWRIADGILLNDGNKYGIMAQCVSNYDVDVRGYADSASSSTAIFQSDGKSRHGRIRCSGRSTDTTMALCVGDYPTQMFLFPNDEGGLDFDDTVLELGDSIDSNFECVRLVGVNGSAIRNTRILGQRHNIRSGSTKIISTYPDPSMYLAGNTLVEGLLIDGVYPSKAGTTACTIIDLNVAGTIKSNGIVIQNCELGFPEEANGGGAINISGGNFADITIRQCYQRAATWQGNVVITSGTCTVANLTIEKTHLRIDNALKNTAWPSSLYLGNTANSTIQKLLVDDCSVTDVSAAGTKSDGVKQYAGVIKFLELRSVRMKDASALLNYNSTDAACKVMATGICIEGAGGVYGLSFNKPVAEVLVGGWSYDSTLVDVVRIGYSTATIKVRSMGGMGAAPSSTKHVNIAVGTANAPDVNGADLICDTTALAAITGNLVRSLATGKVCMYDGAAWTAVA